MSQFVLLVAVYLIAILSFKVIESSSGPQSRNIKFKFRNLIAALPIFVAATYPVLDNYHGLSLNAAVAREESSFVGADRNAVPDEEIIPSQLTQPGKVDINNAPVTDYKRFHSRVNQYLRIISLQTPVIIFLYRFPGMFPHAAGQIASHGPYKSVDDLYQLPSASANDKALFKKYEKELVALPPGRAFVERLNARHSQ